MKAAFISSTTVVVACPDCNAPQENPEDGSHQWERGQIERHAGVRACQECGGRFTLRVPVRVAFGG
jgi:transcriptional regulator NrdR family protein